MQLIKYKNLCLGLSVNICWEDRPLKHQMRQLNKAKNMAGFFFLIKMQLKMKIKHLVKGQTRISQDHLHSKEKNYKNSL